MVWLGLLLLVVIAIQWLTQEVTLKFLGTFAINYHRDEFPALFWSILVLEALMAMLLLRSHFS